jgi:uncharacterized protein (DUF2141 family)
MLLAPANLSAEKLFKRVHIYTPAEEAFSVKAVDLNGDGRPDLVVAGEGSGGGPATVSVLLGNGDGSFQPPQDFDAGGYSIYAIAVADVNGDGKPDVLGPLCLDVSCDNSALAVLLGRGDGTFQAAQTYGLGAVNDLRSSIAVGDVNGDGKLDVLASVCTLGNCGGHVSVLLGNGDGTFQTAYNLDTGRLGGIALAKVNGDGKLDLVVSYSGAIGVLFGNGDGTFQAAKTTATSSDAKLGAVADVNGDGKLDVLLTIGCVDPDCANGAKGGVQVLLGNGDGTFQPGQIFNSGGSLAGALVVGDVNRDGKPDLAVSNSCNTYPSCTQGRIGVLLGNGDGTFQAAQPYASGVFLGQAVALADLNGDHKLDILASGLSTNGGSGAVTVFLGTTLFSTTTTLTSNPNPSVQGQAVTLTATVTSTGNIQPTGKVTFKNGGVLVGGATLVGGVATLTKRNLPVGTLSLTAAYHGDTQSAKSTSPVVIQVVNPAAGRP